MGSQADITGRVVNCTRANWPMKRLPCCIAIYWGIVLDKSASSMKLYWVIPYITIVAFGISVTLGPVYAINISLYIFCFLDGDRCLNAHLPLVLFLYKQQ